MSISRNTWLLIAFLTVAVLLSVGHKLFYPLVEEPQIDFPQTRQPSEELRQFLSGNFVIIDRVQSLPQTVRNAFTEVGAIRSTMANRGERFAATDVILAPGTPRRRLIFAGVYDDKCFVHYEHGGIAHSYAVEFFKLLLTNGMEPVWRGESGRASGGCQSQ